MVHPTLILGSEPRVILAIARSLHRQNIPVYVATMNPGVRQIRSAAIVGTISLPSAKEKPHEFITTLMSLIQIKHFSMLIPASDSALSAVSDHHQLLDQILHLACPPPHILQRVLDKRVTLKMAEQCGIKTPITHFVQDVRQLEADRRKFRFPIIAKPSSKNRPGNFKIRYFQTFEELKAVMEADEHFGQHNLLQEHFPGDGVGIETLIHQGKPIALFQHRRIKEYPTAGGVSVLAVSESVDPILKRQAIDLLRALGWEGIAMVEFRHDPKTGKAVLMEVNGRYYGSLSLSSFAGFDFPFYEWQLAHGERPNPPATYRIGVRWRWTRGEILRINEILFETDAPFIVRPDRYREGFEFILDLLPPTNDALWTKEDLFPALTEVTDTMRDLTRSHAKALLKRIIRFFVNWRKHNNF